MNRTYQIAGAAILLLAVFFGYEALQLRYYSELGPGPGFFPLWLSILLGILATIMLVKATVGVREAMPAEFFAEKAGYLRNAAIVCAVIATIALMEWLGFRLTMFVFYLFLLSVLRRQHFVLNIVIALAGSFGVYQVFDHWLATPLPTGIFGV